MSEFGILAYLKVYKHSFIPQAIDPRLDHHLLDIFSTKFNIDDIDLYIICPQAPLNICTIDGSLKTERWQPQLCTTKTTYTPQQMSLQQAV